MGDKVYTCNDYILSYDEGGENDRSCMIISKILNDNLYVMAELYDGSADVISIMLDDLQKQLQQKENIINELKERSLQYSEEIDRLLDIKKEVEECLNKNRVYITGERNLAFEIEQILDKEVN